MDSLTTNLLRLSSDVSDKHDFGLRKFDDLRGELTKVKDSLQFMIKERADDLDQIGDLLKQSTANTIQEVFKRQDESLKTCSERFEVHIEAVRSQMLARVEREVQDKVRVDEVQDALRRLTEQFQVKLDQLQERNDRMLALKSEENHAKFAITFDSLQGQLKDH